MKSFENVLYSGANASETVTIFMPTLNEIEGLKIILPQIQRNWYSELIVIDGGSTDGTIEFLREHGVDVRQEEQRGVVAAYRQAFRASTGDIFVVLSPDGNCIPELIPTLIAETRRGYDLVCVSRYLPPARSYDDGFLTGIGNHFFSRLISLLFGMRFTDALGVFRAYRRTAVLRMGLDNLAEETWFNRRNDLLNTWEVGGCIRAAKLQLAVKEIPGDEPMRIGGDSKLSIIRNGSMVVAQILYEIWIGRRFVQNK